MTNSESPSNRLYWIDAIRSFACLCVVLVHVPRYIDEQISFYIGYYARAGASILFFMISGALILERPKPVIPFLRKRLSRIVLPMLIWTVVSMLLEVWHGETSWTAFAHRLPAMLCCQQEVTYWFIYVIFGIYLLTPILATWLERCSKRDIQFYLSIWAFTLLLPLLRQFPSPLSSITDYDHGYLYYFYGYVGYAILGHYLRRYVVITRFKWQHCAALAVAIALPFLLMRTGVSQSIVQGRLSINLALVSVCLFLILKHINYSERIKSIAYNFAQHSFGIYLVHFNLMRRALLPALSVLGLPHAIQWPVAFVLTVAASYLLVRLLAKLPYSKYIVGL